MRNDSGVREGDEISMFYDPMIAKLATHAPTRDGAIDAMARALEDLEIEGPGHNAPFLSAVMDQDRFRSGALSTNYIKDEFPDGFGGLAPGTDQLDLMTAAACWMQRVQTVRARRTGHAFAAPMREDFVVVIGPHKQAVRLSGGDAALEIALTGEDRRLKLDHIDWRPGKWLFKAALDGRPFSLEVRPAAEGYVIRHRAARSTVLVLTPLSAEMHERLPPKAAADTSRLIVSPMPGLVVSLDVEVGREVKAGEAVAVIEAMKMQNIIRCERDGVVKSVGAKAGDSVAADEVLIEFN